MKRIKKILAVMLVLVMSMALVAGCSSKSKQTMFGVMKDAKSITHYSYNVDAKLKSSISGLESVALTLKGESDGDAVTIGAKVSYGIITVDVDNLITVTKDAMYVNIQNLFDKIAPILLGSSYSLEDLENEFGVELKCVKLPFVEGMVNSDGSSDELMNTYISIAESAFKDVKITEEKGVFTASVEGAEEFSKVVDAFITALLDNQDTIIAELEKTSIDEAKIRELLSFYMDEVVAAVEKFNADYEYGLTEDDIADLKDELANSIDEVMADTELDDVSSAYRDAFDQLREDKDDIVSEIADFKDGTAKLTVTDSLTGKEGSRVYTSTCDLSAENTNTDEDIQLNINSVMTENSSISVKTPDSYTEFSNIIYAALVFAYENGMLDDIADGIYDVY